MATATITTEHDAKTVPAETEGDTVTLTVTLQEAEVLHSLLAHRVLGVGPALKHTYLVAGALRDAGVEAPIGLFTDRVYCARTPAPALLTAANNTLGKDA